MALKKYKLQNIPEKGKVKFEHSEGRAIVLDENLTDEQCEYLLQGGDNKLAAQYIVAVKEPKETKEVSPK